MTKLDTKIVFNQPEEKPVGAVILLHGMGADYNDFVPLVAELKLPMSVKFVFPNASVIPVTINNGLKMRAWYDILDFGDLHREVDTRGVLQNVAKINFLIEELISEGFKPEQIILAGFSQGGVIGYYTALSSEHDLAGLLIMSSYLPDISLLDVVKMQHKKTLPILVCHGTQDPIVNIAYGRRAIQHLQEFGVNYQWLEYPMQHSVCAAQVKDIAKWMTQVLVK